MSVEAVEPNWMSFDDVAAFLELPHIEVARLLLTGTLPFKVEKHSPNPAYVLRMDVQVDGRSVRAWQQDRWDAARAFRADDLINRAAMKFGMHPTRTTPGVRGPAKTKKRIT